MDIVLEESLKGAERNSGTRYYVASINILLIIELLVDVERHIAPGMSITVETVVSI